MPLTTAPAPGTPATTPGTPTDTAMLQQRIPALLADMDAEHEQVLHSIAALAMVPAQRFASAYSALVAQIEEGFRQEEEMMDAIGYEQIRPHRRDHAELLALLHRLRPYLDDGNAPLADIVMSMMPAMLIRHMSGMDQELALALRQRAEAADTGHPH